MLEKLCSGESGYILHPVPPAAEDGHPNYELSLGALAGPILAWRHDHIRRLQRSRHRTIVSVLLMLVVLFAALAVWALVRP